MHVFPYGDFNEGQNIDVQVCSNAPEVELFVNGKTWGVIKLTMSMEETRQEDGWCLMKRVK